MGLPPRDVAALSIGQWLAIVGAWNRAHAGDRPEHPTDEEFEAAVANAARSFH